MPRRKSPLNPGFSPEARRENLAKCNQRFYNGSPARQIMPGSSRSTTRLSSGLAIPATTGEPRFRHRSFRSISSTRNLALLIASLAAAIARGERPPSQSLKLRAANMAAAMTIACCFACFCRSSMLILRGGREVSQTKRETNSSTLRLWLLSWILRPAVVTIGAVGLSAHFAAGLGSNLSELPRIVPDGAPEGVGLRLA